MVIKLNDIRHKSPKIIQEKVKMTYPLTDLKQTKYKVESS